MCASPTSSTHGDPAEAAELYAAQGADEIVFLDIGAAPDGRRTRFDWVRRAAERVFVPLCVGGGVRSVDDARELLAAGADKAGVNTAAVAGPELLDELAARFGAQFVVLSVDARRRPAGGWEVVTHGGRTPTGLDALSWIEAGVGRGAGEILLTSIDRDGTRSGYDLELLAAAVARGARADRRLGRRRRTGGSGGGARRRSGGGARRLDLPHRPFHGR